MSPTATRVTSGEGPPQVHVLRWKLLLVPVLHQHELYTCPGLLPI
jgi:hypothetical protein